MQEKRSLDPATTATKVLALSHGAMAVICSMVVSWLEDYMNLFSVQYLVLLTNSCFLQISDAKIVVRYIKHKLLA